MTAAAVYALTGVALFGLGLHGVLAHVHLLRRILAMNVLGTGVFMVIIALAYRGPTALPDPVPHAMVLTGIVVAVSTTALALALAVRVTAATGRAAPPDVATREEA